ncbi:DNA-binding transcriptional LysR family regulator [Oxalobacteraceae bacterium GrIS 1.11]
MVHCWSNKGGNTELFNHMALFVEVVKAKGFRRAADALGMPNSTVSRRVSELEKAIGLRLFHRTTRKIELTEAGQLYFERCRGLVDEARWAHEQLGAMVRNPSGVLRVSLPVDLATYFLAPLIADFAERYPGIVFELDLTPRRIDLVSEPFDVAIRMGEQPNSSLIARQIASLPRHLYASPRYVAAFGEPGQPEDLTRHQCLRMSSTSGGSDWTLIGASGQVHVKVGGRFSVNSVGMIRRLAELNMGIAALAEEIAQEGVAHNQLKRIMVDWQITPITVYAMTETRLLPAKTQLFIEFIRDRFLVANTKTPAFG